MTDWFDRAFGRWYLTLYPHRDLPEARRALATLGSLLPTTGRVLDIGTGAGRYLRALDERGFDAIGIDRSASLLAVARNDLGTDRLLRSDMRRLPFRDASFASVVSLFTSFGYFRNQAEHVELLVEWRRVVGGAGVLLLDYLNAGQVRRGLQANSERTVDDLVLEEHRRIEPGEDSDFVVKDAVVRRAGGEVLDRYQERVALYEGPTVERLLQEAGWHVQSRFGDYDGTSAEGDSPRFIVHALAGD